MEESFLQMIDQHQGILVKVSRLYEDQPEDRRDLFQEIVLQLWRSYPKFRAEAKESTWVYRIALNTAITIFRKKTKRNQVLTEVDLPDFVIEENGQLEQLMWAIQRLNKLDKALILLYLEDKSYKEMAEISGYSESNVGVKLNRIKKKLSNILKLEE
ncbi:RNA polymerase sigma factor [Jiulongibacter sp. NS-SX5]|uniref:RNA polymerase sigma factor n=1 Tax=Jiulongibacter sp. NS-SX5 TaxID=3463854 RepID=UPI00405812C3